MLLWERRGSESIATMLGRQACDFSLVDFDQAEALGFGLDRRSILVTGEGTNQTLDVLTLPLVQPECWLFL